MLFVRTFCGLVIFLFIITLSFSYEPILYVNYMELSKKNSGIIGHSHNCYCSFMQVLTFFSYALQTGESRFDGHERIRYTRDVLLKLREEVRLLLGLLVPE